MVALIAMGLQVELVGLENSEGLSMMATLLEYPGSIGMELAVVHAIRYGAQHQNIAVMKG